MYTRDEVCDLIMEDSDHEMEEFVFSGSDDELDAEVLEELDAREMEDMLVGANVILGNDTDDDSYVGDYESKVGEMIVIKKAMLMTEMIVIEKALLVVI